MASKRSSKQTKHRIVVRPSFEPLEGRALMAQGAFLSGFSVGAIGAGSSVHTNAITTDSAGDTFITGSFQGTANFDPNSLASTISTSGSQDTFVAKYSPTATLTWIKTFSGQTSSAVGQGLALAVDTSGNTYVGGSFSGSVAFGGSSTFNVSGKTEAYVAKIDSTGALVWADPIGATANAVDAVNAVALDSTGRPVIGGSFQGTATFGATNQVAGGSTEAFASLLDTSGNFVWSTATKGVLGSTTQINGIAVDPSGNVVGVGKFTGTVNYNPSSPLTTVTSSLLNSSSGFVWKLSSTGAYTFVNTYGGLAGATFDNAVTVDSAGSIYATGGFTGITNLNLGSLVGGLLNTTSSNAFVQKLNSSGTQVWNDGLVGQTGVAQGTAIALDSGGNVQVGGTFSGTIDFAPVASLLNPLTSGATSSVFVAGFDNAGTLVYNIQAGSAGTNTLTGLTVDSNKIVSVVGAYNPPITFGSSTLPANGVVNDFVAKVYTNTATPLAPSVPILQAASDSGASSSDGITNVKSPSFTISTADTYDTVELLRNGSIVASRTGPGAITDPGPVPDGTYNYTAVQVSPLAVTGPASAATSVTILSVAPSTPSQPVLLASDDSGTLGDGITNVSSPHFTGTATPGITVELISGGAIIGTATANGSGVYSVTPSTPWSDGTYPVTVKALDVAGNLSAASASSNVTILTATPATPTQPVLLSSDDSGALGDGITNVKSPHLTGTATPGVTVELISGGVIIGTATANGSGAYSVAPTSPWSDGTYPVTVKALDVAGNLSAASPSASVTILTATPGTPSQPVLLSSDDSGTLGDGITNVKSPHLTGTATPGVTVDLISGGVIIGMATANGSGAYSVTPTSPLSDGTYGVTVVAMDVAGNLSPASPSTSLTILTATPATPTQPVLLSSDDSGTLGDGITNVKSPHFTGTATPGVTVELISGGVIIGMATANGSGAYSVTPSTPLNNGTYSLSVKAMDPAGNLSAASPSTSVTILVATPSTPSQPVLLSSDDSGTLGDGITNVKSPHFTGIATAGQTVELISGGVIIGMATVNGSGGYSVAPSSPWSDGVYTVTVKDVDAAGNLSAASTSANVTISSATPATPSQPVLLASDDSGTVGDGITNVKSPHFTGTATVGQTVELISGGVIIGMATVNGSGAYSVTPTSPLTDGTYTLTVKDIDVAGNLSPASPSTSVTILTTTPGTPSQPVLLSSDDSGTLGDGITNVKSPHFTGTATPGQIVDLISGGVIIGMATVNGSGAYSVAPTSPLSDGIYSVTVKAVDAAGNLSPASASSSLRVLTTTPTTPSQPLLLASDDSGTVGDGITNVKSPHFTGTATPGITIDLVSGGVIIGMATANGSGAYSVTPTSPWSDGTYSVSVTAVDLAGNPSAASAPTNVMILTTTPSTPSQPVLLSSDDSGTLGDGITNVKSPHFTGAATPGLTVDLISGGVIIGMATASGSGAYSVTPTSPLSDGTYTLTVKAVDAAGNFSPVSASTSVTIDTASPSTPTQPVLLSSDDSGTLGDGITNVKSPHFTGFATPGVTVDLISGGVIIGVATANGSGAYSVTPTSPWSDGTYSVTVKAVDVAGNLSPASPSTSVTILTATPGTPSQPILLASDDSGTLGDGITNVKSPHFTGTAAPGVTVDLISGGVIIGMATANGSGAYSVAPTSPLSDGNYSITTVAVDAAGNLSPASASTSLTISTATPSTPSQPVLLSSDDSGTLGDGITNVKSPHFTGFATPGVTVDLISGGVIIGVATANGSGAYSVAPTSPWSDGTYSVTVKAVDAAGNLSPASSSTSVTILTATPSTPSQPVLLSSDDSGTLGDGITNVRAPHFTGTATPNLTVELISGGSIIGMATANGSGVYSVQPSSPWSDGTYPVSVKSIDAAGNLSASSSTTNVTILTTTPAIPSQPVLAPADDTGTQGDGITSVWKPHFTGTATAGQIVDLISGGVIIGMATVDGLGNYSVAPTSPLANGTYTVTVKDVDVAGNSSPASPSTNVTIVVNPPSAPSQPVLLSSDDSGTVGDGITNVKSPHFTGTTTPNQTVDLISGGVVIGMATANASGNYSVSPTSPLTDGTYTFTTKAMDAAGNLSPASGSTSVTIDTASPSTPTQPVLLSSDDSGTVGDGITNVKSPHFTGTATPGATVDLISGGVIIGTATANGSGAYSVTPTSPWSDGTYSVIVKAVDAAGNFSPASASTTVQILSATPSTPSKPVLLASDDSGTVGDGITNVKSPHFTGTATPNQTIELISGGVIIGSARVSGSGAYSVAPSTAWSDGTYSVTVKALDAAGNLSASSASTSVTIDTKAPVTPPPPTLAPVSQEGGPNTTNSQTPSFLVTGIPNMTVEIFDKSDPSTPLGRTTLSADGTGTITLVVPLSPGTHQLYVVYVDAAGNQSPNSAPFDANVTPTDPPQPAAVMLDPRDDTHNPAGGTSVTRPRLIGTGSIPGDTIQWVANNGVVIASATVADDGTFTLQDPFGFANGNHPVYIQESNADGGVSPLSLPFNLLIRASLADYNGDGQSDIAQFNTSTETFELKQNLLKTSNVHQWGISGDVPVQGDFFGDGRTDYAVFRPSNDTFYVLNPSTGAVMIRQWGQSGDIPVPGDYFGDGRTDFAVFRPSSDTFFVYNPLTDAVMIKQWGISGDVPVAGDYFGDGLTDFAVYRPSSQTFFVSEPFTGNILIKQWGTSSADIPVPGDYFADGATDFAVYRPSDETFFAVSPGSQTVLGYHWGDPGDVPVPGDYFGDGHTAFAVYNPSSATFRIADNSANAYFAYQFGSSSVDEPVLLPIALQFNFNSPNIRPAVVTPPSPKNNNNQGGAGNANVVVIPMPADPGSGSTPDTSSTTSNNKKSTSAHDQAIHALSLDRWRPGY